MTDYRLYWELDWDSRAQLHVHSRGNGMEFWNDYNLLHEPPVLNDCDAGALFRAAERFALADIHDLRNLPDEWVYDPDANTDAPEWTMPYGSWRCGDVLVPVLRWPGYPSGTILDDMDGECHLETYQVTRSGILWLLRDNGLEDATVGDVNDVLPLLTDDTALTTAVRRYIKKLDKEADK